MKKIMILGASVLQLPAILKAKEMGLQVIAVDMDPHAVGFMEEDIICELISTVDTKNILAAAKKHRIDGIMTLASDLPMRTVSAVAQELGLVGISSQTAMNTTNKIAMRRCLKEHNVPIPEFYRIDEKNEYLRVVDKFIEKKRKCIIKPADNSGSRGVSLLMDTSLDTVLSAYDYSKSFSHNGEVVVEEYMEGPEVSVEAISVNKICHVIQITDKMTTKAPFFVEMGHSEPSMLSADIQRSIADIACKANMAVGIENGPSHTEIIVTDEGPKIVELGARLGGDNITTHLVPLSTGINMVECSIKIALGESVDLERKYNKGAAIRYLRSEIGRIQEIEGVGEAKAVSGIQQISIVHGIGDYSKEIRSSNDRIGFVIAQEESPEKAIKACEEALQMISVKVGE